MDSANILDICTCGICLQTFDESSKCPRILSCGHSFCYSCIEKLLVQSPCCPTCKAEILFQSTETIPINFSLKSLINIRSQILVPNTSANLEGEISDSHTGDAAKRQRKTCSRKYLSEGYCNEHKHFKELRCMDCELWICGLCTLQHKRCRTLLVEQAYKELKKQVSQRVEEKLGQRKARTERLTESMRVLEEERKSLMEDIKIKEFEIKDREKRIEELKSLKAEESKFCDQLKQLQAIVEISANDAEFSKNLLELEKLLEDTKKQIPVNLPPRHLPQTREALGTLCQSGFVYAVEDRYDGTRYGKVALKDGRIFVNSLQPEKPEDATLFALPELLSRFNNESSELPKTVFLRVTPNIRRRDDFSFEVIIETDGLTPRAKNFILLCSALKGPSYKGLTMGEVMNWYGNYIPAFCTLSAPLPVEGIRDNDNKWAQVKEGVVYGMGREHSRFVIQLKDCLYFADPKFGVVVTGLQLMKNLQGRKCSIEECGLVI